MRYAPVLLATFEYDKYVRCHFHGYSPAIVMVYAMPFSWLRPMELVTLPVRYTGASCISIKHQHDDAPTISLVAVV